MQAAQPTVHVVDDDADLSRALARLFESAGLRVATYASAQDFLDAHDRDAPGCLLLDLSLPGLNGLELQRTLQQQASTLPIVFLTGRGDIAASVQAMKHGARDFLTKPVDDIALIAAIEEALAANRKRRRANAEHDRDTACLASLTARERQVLEQIVAGRLNKQIAAALGTVEKTVKFHRANLMRKMGVRVVADLVKVAQRAGVGAPPSIDAPAAAPAPDGTWTKVQ